MKRLLKFTSICFVALFVLASCASTYTIDYKSSVVESGGEGPEVDSSELVTSYKGKKEVVINALEDEAGYTFKGWAEEGESSSEAVETYSFKDSKENKTLVAYWNLKEFAISYDSRLDEEGDGTAPGIDAQALGLPVEYTYESGAEIKDISGSENGYVFEGWVEKENDTPEKTVHLIKKTADAVGDRKFTSVWKYENYSLNVSRRFIEGSDYPSSLLPSLPALMETYNLSDAGAVLPELSAPGCIFIGWIEEGEDEKTAVKSYTLKEGLTGEKSIVALWDLQKYSLEYSARFASGLNYDESLVPELPSLLDSYTIADAGATLPELSYPGYVFIGWIEEGCDESTAVKSYTLEEGESGDRRLVALWDLDEYAVQYTSRFVSGKDYDESLLPILPSLIDSYTLADGGTVLSPLNCTGYVFKGWIEDGMDESSAVMNYTISGKPEGDVTLVALWDLEEYSVTTESRFISGRNYDESLLPSVTSIPEKYTLSDAGTVVPELEKDGYIFCGWIIDGMDESYAVKSYTLPEGITGDWKVVALWDLEEYTVTYTSRFVSEKEYDELLLPILPALMDSYTIADKGTVLPSLDCTGYVFKGWIEEGMDSSSAFYSYTVTENTMGDRNLVALWDLMEYTVNSESRFISGRNYDESLLPSVTSIPEKYTLSDAGTVVPELEKDGYIFCGWIIDGMDESYAVKSYTLPEGITGDWNVVALWDLEVYPIEYSARFVSGEDLSSFEVPSLPVLLSSYTIQDVGAILPVLEKSGYTFKGWIEKGNDESTALLSYTLEEGVLGAKSVVALWDVVRYPITYDEDGIIANDPVIVVETAQEEVIIPEPVVYENRKSYTVEDEVTFLNPTRTGFTFIGWIEKDQKVESANDEYRIEVGTVGEKDLVAVWHRNCYQISYDLNDGIFTEDAAVSYMYDDQHGVPLLTPVRDFYEFTGWKEKTSGVIYNDEFTDTAVDRDIVLEAEWTPVVYTIEYDLNGGSMEEKDNPATYTYETDTFTLITPVRRGYTFTGWTVEETVEIDPELFSLTFSVEDIDITVRMYTRKSEWVLPSFFKETEIDMIDEFLSVNFPEAKTKRNGNIITLDYQNSDSALLEMLVKRIVSEAGFVYEYEKTAEAEVGYEAITIAQGSNGNRKYRAEWEINTYTLTYGGEEPYALRFPPEEPVKEVNRTTFTVEDETFTLINPEKFGYDFMGWVLDNGEYTEAQTVVTIEKGSIDDRLYTPLFRIHDYSVSVDLAGGEGEYINSYTILDGKLELARPVREHYIFLGWIDGDGNFSEDAVINSAEGSDRAFTALWEPVTYSLTYDLGGGEYLKGEGNKETYNVETVYTLTSPVRYGYTFLGWTENEEVKPVVSLSLDAQRGGDRSFKAVWKADEYKICYDLGGGEFTQDVVDSYTIEDKVELPAPERHGYTFIGWVDEKGSEKKDVDTTLLREQTFTALWNTVEYSVKYDLRGGTYERGSRDNIASYTVETPDWLLTNPVRDKYEFAGWVSEEREDRDYAVVDYTIDCEKGGNLSLVATWKEAEYSISYDLDGGQFDYDDSNRHSFTNFDEEFSLTSPSREGYSFLGWVEKGKEGNRPLVGYTVKTESLRDNLSLKAVWVETSFTISYTLNGGSYARGSEPNRTSYLKSDAPFVLTNPVRDGYKFLGWVRRAYSTTDVPSTEYTVDTSKGGVLSYEAVWESEVYSISYDLDGGSYRYGNSNPETYTSDDSFELAKPYKEGYTFLGWIVSGDAGENVISEYTVREGSKGDLAFYAVYKENLVALGEVTMMQKKIVEKGKYDIPRPDWVIGVPTDSSYHYEKAYASGSDFHENMKAAKEECIKNIASWLGTSVTNINKQVNSVKQVTFTIDSSADVENAELVEYWEDSTGGVWVLMRVNK